MDSHHVNVLLKEYEKQIGIQKEAKDRFIRIALLHNAGIGAFVLWLVEKTPQVSLAELSSGDQYLASLAMLVIMNAILITGSCYQVYSFFSSALRMCVIRRSMAEKLGADLFQSEEDLGRFPDMGIWLAKRSETFPIIMWFTGPFLVLMIGVYMSFKIILCSSCFIGFLFVMADFLSFMAVLYVFGLALWYRKVSIVGKNVLIDAGP